MIPLKKVKGVYTVRNTWFSEVQFELYAVGTVCHFALPLSILCMSRMRTVLIMDVGKQRRKTKDP